MFMHFGIWCLSASRMVLVSVVYAVCLCECVGIFAFLKASSVYSVIFFVVSI